MSKVEKPELHEGFIKNSVEFAEITDIVAVGLDLMYVLVHLKNTSKFNRQLAEILDENNKKETNLIET